MIRLGWAAAFPVAAGLAGELTSGLAWTIAGWVALSAGVQLLPDRIPLLAPAIDLTFVTLAVILTGVADTPLWWSLLVACGLAGLQHGVLAGLLLPPLSLVAAMGYGLAAGSIQAEDLGPLGRALLGVMVLTPLVSWGAHWLGERLRQGADPQQAGDSDALAASMLGLSAELNAALAVERIPEMVVDLASEALNAADGQLRSALLLRSEHGYQVTTGDRDHATLLPGEHGALRAVVNSGRALKLRRAADDPEIGRLEIASGTRTAACVPLVANGQTHGALLLTHPRADYFTPPRMSLLDAIAAQASIALQNAQLFRGLELERDRITEAEEETRRKLARDLHDGPTQTIAAIAMRLDFARRLVARDQQAAEEEIQTLEEIARQTTREIRHMLFTLRPLVLESKGLVAALHQLANKLYETHGRQVVVEAQPEVADGLDLSKQAVIFFIAEEAINNAHKHAEAANIWVELGRADLDRIVLQVRDDGVGFNVGAVDANYEQRGSLGMVNMRERSELVHGVLRIDSAEGKGTQITLEVPLNSE